MSKKKILVDIFYLHVAQTGIRTYIECLCEEIEGKESEDFEFIVTPGRDSIQNSHFFKGKTAVWKNLLYQIVYFYRKLIVIPWLSVRYNADVIFSPDILSPVWAKGVKISVIHDAFFWENPSHYNPIWLKVYLFLLKSGLRSNAHVVTISEYSKKQIKKYLEMPELPVHVVYPSSNIRAKGERMSVSPLADSYFLHVGVMEKRKNLLVLIRAFSIFIQDEKFESYKLVLVGQRGPRKTLDDYGNIVKLIKELNLQGKVILPGHVSLQELEDYYHHALSYIFPSLNEGFGMPILEAFSYGVPVIISYQGTLMEVGGDAVLAVGENSPGGFRKALYQLAEDSQLRAEMARRGFIRLEQFSSASFFLSLQGCFRSILNE